MNTLVVTSAEESRIASLTGRVQSIINLLFLFLSAEDTEAEEAFAMKRKPGLKEGVFYLVFIILSI